MQFNFDLMHNKIDDGNLRWVEIYRITNKVNNFCLLKIDEFNGRIGFR